jgi:hypothetical protein
MDKHECHGDTDDSRDKDYFLPVDSAPGIVQVQTDKIMRFHFPAPFDENARDAYAPGISTFFIF